MIASDLSAVYLVYLAVPVVTIVIGLGLMAWIYRNHWEKRGAQSFVGVLFVGGIWLWLLVFHLLFTDPFWQQVLVIEQAFFALLTITSFGLFASIYTGQEYHRNPVVGGGLTLIFVSLLLGAVTNDYHNLLWYSITPVTDPFPYAVLDPGVGAVAIIAVLLVFVWYGWLQLVRYMLVTGSGSATQLLLVVLAALPIALAQLVGMWGYLPADGLIHAAYGTLPFVVFASLGLFRFRLLDMLPVARTAIVESLDDAVLILDPERRVADANDEASRLWPAIDDRVGEPFARACPTLADRIDIPADGDRTTSDRLTLDAAGVERHYSVKTTLVTRGRAEEVGWYAILLRDVTELEQSRWQLEKQNERLDQVASTISHDLRNPISVADGHLDLALSELDDDGMTPEQVERVRESLERARDPHERMIEIIEDVLTLAREGKTVQETDAVALEDMAERAWGNVATARATLQVTGDRRLRADSNRLLRIFENLFRNAIDHGPADVTVEVGTTEDGFYVADDGPGIPAEHADSVFEYGYTTSEEGTGLGLSIVKTMAESHGWTVEHEDCDAAGTRFVFGGVVTEPAPARDTA